MKGAPAKVQPASDSAGLSEAVHTIGGVVTGKHGVADSLLEATMGFRFRRSMKMPHLQSHEGAE